MVLLITQASTCIPSLGTWICTQPVLRTDDCLQYCDTVGIFSLHWAGYIYSMYMYQDVMLKVNQSVTLIMP